MKDFVIFTGDLVVNEDDCSTKSPKETCPLRCKDTTAKLTGDNSITCRENTKWSVLPSCGSAYCPPPKFPPTSVLKTIEECSGKAVNQICNLECGNGGDLVGKNHTKCLRNQQWSPAPNCTCPKPKLMENVEFDGTCATWAREETCNVKCKSGFKTEGKTTITCLQDLSWSSQPNCTKLCPKPKLAESYLKSDEGCVEGAAGSSCKLSCVEGGKLDGDNVIKCSLNGEWTPLPKCFCPKPILTADLIENEDCSAKKPKEKCELGCRNATSKLTGNRFIFCNIDNKWGQLPTCSATQCPLPSFANGELRSKEDCSTKYIHQTCSLECSKGGNLIGEGYIKCLQDQTWSRLPECTCPIPKLGPNIEFSSPCGNVAKNKLCKLKCKTGYEMTGGNLITCMNDLSWHDLESVECKKRCPVPNFSKNYLTPTMDCSNVFEGQFCEYKCSTGGKVAANSGTSTGRTTCQKDGTWSPFEQCYCPLTDIPDDVVATRDCSKVKAHETCHFRCVDDSLHLIGKDYFACLSDLTWQTQEIKCDKACLKPNFKSPALKLGDDCLQTLPGSHCKVLCTNGGKVFGGGENLKCLDGGVWDTFPVCTCPIPVFHNTFLKSEEDCSSKKPFETCKLKCVKGYRTKSIPFHNLQCDSSSHWDALPACFPVWPNNIILLVLCTKL